ncbi:MAG: hypothetical protein LQ340_007078 [Diploschistes diacapsis]|nr:MAG: hypothetical protein LQ340_007078 [Diploschistes diacapsis]
MGAAIVAAVPQNLDTIASELPALVSQLGPLVTQVAGGLGPELATLQIPGINPTAVVSDLPAVLASNLPMLEGLALGSIPSGIFSPAEMSAISADSPAVFTALVQNIDGLISQLPQTLPITALGGYVASNLPIIESAVLADISSLIPEASSILTAVEAQATGGSIGTTGGFPGATATVTSFSGALTPTSSAPLQTFTGAASANAWGKEVMGAAAAVGILGAML